MAGLVTFISVVTGLIVVGEARLATLLVAADLIVSGFSATQQAEEEEDEVAPQAKGAETPQSPQWPRERRCLGRHRGLRRGQIGDGSSHRIRVRPPCPWTASTAPTPPW